MILEKEKRKTGRTWTRGIWIVLSALGMLVVWSMEFGFYSPGNFYKMYVDVPTFLLIVVTVLLVLLIAGVEKDFIRGFGLAFSRKKGVSRIELQKSLKTIQYVERTVMLVAILVLVVPLVDIFYHMDNAITAGPALGVISLGVLYPVLFLLVLMPVKLRLEQKVISYMEEPEDEEAERKEADGQRLYFGLRSLGLTDREAEVARLAAAGMTNAEIGQELYISMATVKKHMTHVLEKTQCGDREALAEKVRGM